MTAAPKEAANAWPWPLSLWKPALAWAIFLLGYLVHLPVMRSVLAVDWLQYYVPAFRATVQGLNPYIQGTGYFNPPWALLLVAPFAVLPKDAGIWSYLAFTFISYIIIARKLGAKPLALAMFMISPAVFQSFALLNLDVWALWGFVLPAPIGMLLVLVKPQMGIVFAGFLLLRAYLEGGFRRAFVTLLPTLCAVILSKLLYWNWLQALWVNRTALQHAQWNVSIWPWGLLAGVPLLAWVVWKQHRGSAMASSVLLSPYVSWPSWTALLAGVLRSDAWTFAIVIAMYILMLTVPR